ncbi:MAG: glycosyltransferase family protein [Balneolaceae bacterium]
MNILYGIQGTGHGHISRAREILPYLSAHANLDVLISGYNCKLGIEGYSIIKKRGISFEYDNQGSVSILDTALSLDPVSLIRDIQNLDTGRYDLIISDYEPITSWASIVSKTPCIGLSHQASFHSNKSPRPLKISLISEQIMKHFAPCTRPLGFHFNRYDTFIEPPVIRKQVRELNPLFGDHYTVYLPAFDHESLVSMFVRFKNTRWEIFSPYCNKPYTKKNVTVLKVGNEPFLKSLESCSGVITSAGFETCAEAMYLNKKLFVIPIKNQYEQLCNAAALEKMGISVANSWGKEFDLKISNWLLNKKAVQLNEIADTEKIAQMLIRLARRFSHRKANLYQ